MTTTIAGRTVELNEEGYLANAADWTREMAVELAASLGIVLSERHWKVIEYLRAETARGAGLPSIRRLKSEGVMPTKDLYELFPDGPLKKAALIAGLPKPASCV